MSVRTFPEILTHTQSITSVQVTEKKVKIQLHFQLYIKNRSHIFR